MRCYWKLLKRLKLSNVARQVLEEKNIELYSNGERIFAPVGKVYNSIHRPPLGFWCGKKFVEQTFYLESHAQVVKAGFCVVVKKGAGYFAGQRVKYVLERYVPGKKHLKELPHRREHYVEYDHSKKCARLCGKNAGRWCLGEWVTLKDKQKKVKVVKRSVDYYQKNYDNILTHLEDKLVGGSPKPTFKKINGIPIMFTDNNELLCLPQEADEPSILIVGQRRCILPETELWINGQNLTARELLDNFNTSDYYSTIGVDDNIPVINQVLDVFDNGIQQCSKVKTCSGITFICTYNHKHITSRGECKTQELKIGDRLSTLRFKSQELLKNDIYWDEVISIEDVGEKETIGLNVSGSNTFMTYEGLITHNSGKSYFMHSIADRVYWNPYWPKRLAVINDSLRECGTWCLPNYSKTDMYTMKKLNERPIGLPCIYLHPNTNDFKDQDILNPKTVGVKITLPFEEVIGNLPRYFDFGITVELFHVR